MLDYTVAVLDKDEPAKVKVERPIREAHVDAVANLHTWDH